MPTAFVGAGGAWMSDRYHLGLDYGNVIYDRRHRFLTTYLYELPFGKGKKLVSNAGGFVDELVGGWEVAGVLVFQSGPFLTPSQSSSDPSGTNMINVVGTTRPDVVAGVNPYGNRTTTNYLNVNAFAVPASNIGRFGNASVGSIVGPGTQAVSMSLIKTVRFAESTKLQFGVEVANLLNHRNYEPPNMAVDTAAFGTITGLQSAEGAGPRAVQLTGRITF